MRLQCTSNCIDIRRLAVAVSVALRLLSSLKERRREAVSKLAPTPNHKGLAEVSPTDQLFVPFPSVSGANDTGERLLRPVVTCDVLDVAGELTTDGCAQPLLVLAVVLQSLIRTSGTIAIRRTDLVLFRTSLTERAC